MRNDDDPPATTEGILRDAAHDSRVDEAWQRLFQRYQPRLLAFTDFKLGPKLRGHIDADDIANECWLKVFEQRARFEYRGPDSFYRWLCTQVHRRIRDASRFIRSRDAKVAIQALPDLDPSAHGLGPRTQADQRELVRRAIEALETLDDTYRIPLELYHLQMRPQRSIALELDLKLNTVTQQLSRGLERWRNALGADPLAALE